MDDDQGDFDLLAASLPPIPSPSRIKRRLIESAVAIDADDPESVVYQHTVLCQTCLPYRDPGDGVREWQRKQGAVSLKVDAGEAHHPDTGEWIKLGLPWGAKPRLICRPSTSRACRNTACRSTSGR